MVSTAEAETVASLSRAAPDVPSASGACRLAEEGSESDYAAIAAAGLASSAATNAFASPSPRASRTFSSSDCSSLS
jgi:hypothetical protein